MAQLSALTRLYARIADSLSEEDVKSLRALVAPEHLGKARVERAIPQEIFNMLEEDNKIGKGNLGLLVQILRSLRKGKLADEAEQLEQEQREEDTDKDVAKAAAKYKAAVEAVISKISQKVDNLDRELTATAQNCEQVEKEVKQHYEKLISKLQQEKQEMISKIQKIKEDRERELTREKEKLETELKNNRKEEKFCEQILDRQDGTEALKEIKERLQQMEEKIEKLSMQETGNSSLAGQTKVTFKQLLSEVPGGSVFPQEKEEKPPKVSPSDSLSESVRFTIDVQEPAVESLPCSVTVTTNNADLTGGKVAPQIEVTSSNGKTTLIQTTAHTSPPLAAGKGQTSRVSRVWCAEWRPQQSGKHTLGVCMGGTEDLGSLTVDVSCNNPVVSFGENGSQQGQFRCPTDVAVRGDRLYVADANNDRVQVFDLSGKFCHSFPTTGPLGLAVQTDGTIVVKSGKEVKKFSPSGELLHKFPLGKYCTTPYGLAVQRDGRVVVADRDKHSIFLFEADGTLVKKVGGKGEGEGQFDRPHFVCVDKEDNIIVADTVNHRVQVFDRNLDYKHKFGQWGRQPQDMWGPSGVSADSRGNIVLANAGGTTDGVKHNVKLQVFHPDGTWVSTISSDGDKLKFPCGVAVTEDGHVFVADIWDDCIRKYRYM
ncbi:uncharacterized protein LOC144903090 [Branchiostoma floridae x Branchiostoma belcheri]